MNGSVSPFWGGFVQYSSVTKAAARVVRDGDGFHVRKILHERMPQEHAIALHLREKECPLVRFSQKVVVRAIYMMRKAHLQHNTNNNKTRHTIRRFSKSASLILSSFCTRSSIAIESAAPRQLRAGADARSAPAHESPPNHAVQRIALKRWAFPQSVPGPPPHGYARLKLQLFRFPDDGFVPRSCPSSS